MPPPRIRATTDGRGVMTWVIDDPSTRNALGLAELELAGDLLEGLDAADTRAVVVTAAGSVFSSGADLKETDRPGYLDRSTELLGRVLHLIDTVPVPVVSRVNGPAFGSGLAIVAASDIAVTVDTARFALPEVRYGMVGGPAAAAALRRVGETALLDLMLTGRSLEATAAARIGLVAEVVRADLLDATVSDRVDAILAGDAAAVARTKAVVRSLSWRTMDESLARL